ncbi:hypothetical protein V6N12_033078 [Hibiscus sabdariffa]|uniref:Uncharacterized protein n=1 Tax=Hibiscus sabdariffa TaxID=183260 RepID=A0ABR2BCH5_9ROSI
MKLITGRHTSSTSSMLAMNEDKLFSIANHTLIVVAQDASYVQSAVTSYYNITTGVFRYKNSVYGLNSDVSLVKLPLSDNMKATSNFVSRIRTARVRQNPRLNVSRHIEFTSQSPQPLLIATTPSVLSLVVMTSISSHTCLYESHMEVPNLFSLINENLPGLFAKNLSATHPLAGKCTVIINGGSTGLYNIGLVIIR